jgi:hypothetical protein
VKPGRWILLALVLSGAGFFAWRRYGGEIEQRLDTRAATLPERMVPAGVRIKVQVLNATRVAGLARRATLFLRDRGFDVVETGTAEAQRRTTLVLDRSQHPEWAGLVARALGAVVESRPDSTRFLDVTVLLGDDWRPPPLPFYP